MSVRNLRKLLVTSLAGTIAVMTAPMAVAEPHADGTPTGNPTSSAAASEGPAPSPSASAGQSPSPTPTNSTTAPAPVPTDSGMPTPSAPTGPITSPVTVAFGGVSLEIPAGWHVVDLRESPNKCVRFDENVIYLGTPSAKQDCPAEVTGRTEALVLTDDGTTLSFDQPTSLTAGTRPQDGALQSISGEASWRIADSAVTVYATIAAHPEVIADILATVRVTEPARAPKLKGPALTASTNAVLPGSFTRYYGRGFDACAAPSISLMNAWASSSPFGSIGIYIGGSARGCSQPNLTASWLSSISASGWRAQPIYVGPQAPCSAFASRIDPASAASQGQQAAQDAAARARALGLGPTSDIYYDMESYARGGTCTSAVQTFLSAWTQQLHAEGYRSGVYSSASTGIQDLVTGLSVPGFAPPDRVWIARWNGQETVQDPAISASLWSDNQRMHQYRGGQVEQYGGFSVNIDRNWIETDPARGRPTGSFDGATGGYGTVAVSGWAVAPGNLAATVNVQVAVDSVAISTIPANKPRPDVGALYPDYGANRGFSADVAATTGWHTVCLSSLDTGGGAPGSLGCLTVFVQSTTPFGYVESVSTSGESITAVGWALDPKTTNSNTVQITLDSQASATAPAATPRGDLVAHYPGLGVNHGFQISIAASPGTHTVCLSSLDTRGGPSGSLGCRAVTVPNNRPFGRIDSIETYGGLISLYGWAIDPKTAASITVKMSLDGSATTTAPASGSRGDIAAAFPSSGPNHGFSVALQAAPGNHVVCLYAIDSAGGPATTLGCPTVYIPDRAPFGYLDSAIGGKSMITATGWTIDHKTVNPIQVQLYVDGAPNTTVLANQNRPDVGAGYPWAGPNHGFTATITAKAGTHTVCAYGINSGLGSSPLLGCRSVNVS